MSNIYRIETVAELNELLSQDKAKHPLISIVDFAKVKSYKKDLNKISTSFYSIMLKNNCTGNIKYGRQYYDFQDGTLIFLGPEQVITIEESENNDDVNGWGLFFHPDLVRGTTLGQKMKDYTFFSYDANEALHLSDSEKHMLADIISKIEVELNQNIDKHSQTLIATNIELLLNYCSRYYDRQFITRSNSNIDVLAKFDGVLSHYFSSELVKDKGLPTVKYCAEKLQLSPNYLSDLLKKETGKNAQEHIHYHLVEEAKNKLLNSSNTVSEIAYDLGFEYPQYFSRMFKKKTGFSPANYRNLN